MIELKPKDSLATDETDQIIRLINQVHYALSLQWLKMENSSTNINHVQHFL